MAVTERVTLQEITAATVRDSRWQKRGYGSAALELLIDHARTLPGVTRLRTSYVPSARTMRPACTSAGDSAQPARWTRAKS